MADNKSTSQLAAAAALTGAELVALVQSGTDVQSTAQDIADLAAGSGPAGSSGDVQTNGGGSPATFAGLPIIGFVQWADGGADEVPIADGAGSGTWGAQSGGGGSLSQAVTLTAADRAALDVTPFVLVTAPAADEIVLPNLFITLSYDGFLVCGTFNGSFYYTDKNGYDITPDQNTAIDSALDTGEGGAHTTMAQIFRPGDAVANLASPLFPAPGIEITANKGKAIVLQAVAPYLIAGSILTSQLNTSIATSSGWAANDTFDLTPNWSTNPANVVHGVVDTVDGGGRVLTYHLTNAGTTGGYAPEDLYGAAPTSGVGVDLYIEILTVDYASNDQKLVIKTYYDKFTIA